MDVPVLVTDTYQSINNIYEICISWQAKYDAKNAA